MARPVRRFEIISLDYRWTCRLAQCDKTSTVALLKCLGLVGMESGGPRAELWAWACRCTTIVKLGLKPAPLLLSPGQSQESQWWGTIPLWLRCPWPPSLDHVHRREGDGSCAKCAPVDSALGKKDEVELPAWNGKCFKWYFYEKIPKYESTHVACVFLVKEGSYSLTSVNVVIVFV
jgi:hypothetical protein